MNYRQIPIGIKFLSSLSSSLVLWFCLVGLEFRVAYDSRIKMSGDPFHWSKLIEHNHAFSFSFDPIFGYLADSTYFSFSMTMLIIAFCTTLLLGLIIRHQVIKSPAVGSARKVRTIKLMPHDNEFLLKCSGLITIITVLYTASSGFALICTFLLSCYSPIWAYNTLIRLTGCVFVKACVQLDPDRTEVTEILVISTKSAIQSFVYDPTNPMKMNIILFNKISLIGKQ